MRDGVIQEPPDWVGPGAIDEQLGQEGDFLIGANVAYFGTSQLRTVGADLRRVWEQERGHADYIVMSNRPRPILMLDERLLRDLARMVITGELLSCPDRGTARALGLQHLRAFRRAYYSEPESREERIQRVLARWAWMP